MVRSLGIFMISNERILVLTEIVHYCNPSGEETRIRNRFNLNSVQAEAYLTLLKQRQLLAQNDGKYHITERREFSRFLRKLNGRK